MIKKPYIPIGTQREMHRFFMERAAPKYFLLQRMTAILKRYTSDGEK